jgi:hypothetical protein
VRLPERDEHVLLGALVVLAEERLERRGGLPGVVVGDLGADVVRDVGLAQAVDEVGADGAKEGTVNGAEGAAGEGPELVRVVGWRVSKRATLLCALYSRMVGSVCCR